jgi:hypothetical protein
MSIARLHFLLSIKFKGYIRLISALTLLQMSLVYYIYAKYLLNLYNNFFSIIKRLARLEHYIFEKILYLSKS